MWATMFASQSIHIINRLFLGLIQAGPGWSSILIPDHCLLSSQIPEQLRWHCILETEKKRLQIRLVFAKFHWLPVVTAFWVPITVVVVVASFSSCPSIHPSHEYGTLADRVQQEDALGFGRVNPLRAALITISMCKGWAAPGLPLFLHFSAYYPWLPVNL